MNNGLFRACTLCSSTIFKNFIPVLRFSTSCNFQNANEKDVNVTEAPKTRRRKEILKLPESELEGYAIGVKKLPLTERRGEEQSVYRHMVTEDTKSNNKVDFLNWAHAEIDFRPSTVKRWWKSVDAEYEIVQQSFNEKRDRVLGNDLSAAHFILSRKGKVRFKGHSDWIKTYRKDMVTGKENEEDLPAMTFDICTVPTKYDPRFRLEAIDASHMTLIYEGLSNLENLEYIKWLSFKSCPHMDDWCLDRVFRIFSEKLEYLDISGCENVSGRAIGAVRRCRKLKTLVVEDMAHVKDLEIICSQLEDEMPDLHVIGVDYEAKLLQLRLQNEKTKLKELKEVIELEDNTITVESKDDVEKEKQLSLKVNK